MQTKLYLHPVSAYVEEHVYKNKAQTCECSHDACSIKMVTMVKEQKISLKVQSSLVSSFSDLFIKCLTCGASYGRVSFNMDPLSPSLGWERGHKNKKVCAK